MIAQRVAAFQLEHFIDSQPIWSVRSVDLKYYVIVLFTVYLSTLNMCAVGTGIV